MSNQGTDCFLELLEKAAVGTDMTENQRKLLGFLKERRQVNLTALSEPIKDLLQEMVISENEAEIIEEALLLLEAYLEPPFDILARSVEKVPTRFLPAVRCLLDSAE